MADTTFTDGVTVVEASWLNDINDHVYGTFHDDFLKKDGTVTPTANLPMGTYKFTGAGDASATGQFLTWGQTGTFAVGSAASPGITFNGDANTGISAATADTLVLSTAGTARATVDSSGNVGIAKTPSAGYRLDILGANNSAGIGANTDVRVASNDGTVSTVYGWNQLNSSSDYLMGRGGVTKLKLATDNVIADTVALVCSYDGTAPTAISDGDIVSRRSTTEGAIYFGDGLGRYVYGSGVNLYLGTTFTFVGPQTDNATSLGGGANRFTVVYATTGTINTSDEDTKEEIEELTAKEKRVALTIKNSIRRYKFTDAVNAKGADNARIHVGVTAQAVREAFVAEGLNPRRYGMFCEDTWYELPDGTQVTESTPGAVQRRRLGIRYEELLTFIIAAL